jgi:RimJ/RimL family protein N-acetyltransferase
MIPEFSIKDEGVQLEACLVPWDTKVFNFPIVHISNLAFTDLTQAHTAFETLRQWVKTHDIKMISCRLPHDHLEATFLLEQQGFRFIETVLHPVIENVQDLRVNATELQVREVLEHEVEMIQAMAEQCFAHERFHADPRLSTKLANERYGRWVVNSFQSSNQLLLKIEDRSEIVAFFVVENLNDKKVYWHLTAVAPAFQGRGYGRKTWQTMLAYHKTKGAERVATTISARNVRVLNLYSKLQFKFAPPEMTFHWIVE